MKKIEKKCRSCKNKIVVRLADHKRGWGNFCNKSCAARYKIAKGVMPRCREIDLENSYIGRYGEDAHPFSSEALGQWDD